jgi:hypothetical protein
MGGGQGGAVGQCFVVSMLGSISGRGKLQMERYEAWAWVVLVGRVGGRPLLCDFLSG